MCGTFHGSLTPGDIYILANFTYANAAARTGATGIVAGDVGKVAWQQDDNSFFVLTDDSPVTWAPLGGDTTAPLAAHIADATAAHAASAIGFTPAGAIAATDVQAAIAEAASDAATATGTVATDLAGHLADTSAAHAATAIAFTPNGSIAATTVQAAIQEVRDEAGGGSLPVGGTTGQVLTKASGADGDADWETPTGGGGGGGNIYEPLATPPTSAHAKDDEFTAGSLDGKWTNPAVSGRTNTIVLSDGFISIEPSESGSSSTGSKGSNGIRQAAPTGSFTVIARIADNAPGNDDCRMGIFVGRTTGGKGHLWGPYRSAGFFANYCTFGYDEAAVWNYDSDLTTNIGPFVGYGMGYFKIVWDSTASTLTFWYSVDGIFWTLAVTRTSQLQPDRIGLVLWSNAGTLLANHQLACDFFRVTEP